jgi:dTMP kinase
MKGKFITFEGPEGCGKSTQVQRLKAGLEERGIEVICTREPGGTATGEAIRNLLQHNASGEELCDECELLLFAASRAQIMSNVILPAVERGVWVICDRFIDSTLAYQGYGRGMKLEDLRAINDFAIEGVKPDLTLLLDIPQEVSSSRLHKRFAELNEKADRFELLGDGFHSRVRSGYLELAEREPARICVIDGTQSPDEVTELINARIQGLG